MGVGCWKWVPVTLPWVPSRTPVATLYMGPVHCDGRHPIVIARLSRKWPMTAAANIARHGLNAMPPVVGALTDHRQDGRAPTSVVR